MLGSLSIVGLVDVRTKIDAFFVLLSNMLKEVLTFVVFLSLVNLIENFISSAGPVS